MVVVGGIGQIKGAVIAAFVLGVRAVVVRVLHHRVSIAKVLVFVAIVAFLQVRPQGMFNVRTRSLA